MSMVHRKESDDDGCDEKDAVPFFGTPFTKLLEVVAQGRTVEKRGNVAHLTSTGGKGQTSWEKRQAARLHGAFTGGFSAGYFNTVGSQEGWSVRSFKSSRSERSEITTQRPEDFMDEEDVGEFGIAPKMLQLADAFTDTVSCRSNERSTSSDERFVTQMLMPSSQSFGSRLLRMQLYKHVKAQPLSNDLTVTLLDKSGETSVALESAPKVYGAALPPANLRRYLKAFDDDMNDEGTDSSASHFLSLAFSEKDSISWHRGLGYKEFLDSSACKSERSRFEQSGLTLTASHEKLSRRPGPGRGISGQAFGVGVAEDELGNDEGFTNISNYFGDDELSQYDFAIGGPSQSKDSRTSLALADSAEAGDRSVAFVPSSGALIKRRYFKPPKLPCDYTPIHKPDARASVALPVVSSHRADQPMNPVRRAQQLGECYSATTLVPDNERRRLATSGTTTTIHANVSLDAVEQNAPCKEEQKSSVASVFYTRSSESTAVLDWEREAGMQAIKRTHLYQPMLAQIQSRFATTGDMDDACAVVAGSTEDPAEKQAGDDKRSAVKLKLFGRLTRFVFEWHPEHLLCRRMNVPNPYPESELVGTVDADDTKKNKNLAKSAMGGLISTNFTPTQDELNRVKHVAENSKLSSSRLNPSTSLVPNDGTSSHRDGDGICSEADLFATVFGASSDEESSASDSEQHSDVKQKSAASVAACSPVVSNTNKLCASERAELSVEFVSAVSEFTVSASTSDVPLVADAGSRSCDATASDCYGPRLPSEANAFACEQQPTSALHRRQADGAKIKRKKEKRSKSRSRSVSGSRRRDHRHAKSKHRHHTHHSSKKRRH